VKLREVHESARALTADSGSARRYGRYRCGYLLGQDPGFFEAEISLPITHRLTYNNMIKEIDLKNASGFSDATCKPGVGFRGFTSPLGWLCYLDPIIM